MTLKRVAVLGMGSIGLSVAELWKKQAPAGCEFVAACGRPRQAEALVGALPDGARFVSTVDELLAARPDIVVEAAGHDAIIEHGSRLLASGADLYLLSVGVLANAGVRDNLLAAAKAGNSLIVVPAGALAGFDGLKALVADGDTEVTYISAKPPHAWAGTWAETEHDLGSITSATTVFDGSAADAARLFPRNANLAAAVATAGIGFGRTRVILVADPACEGNFGEIRASNAHSALHVRVDGSANPSNPKTSRIVGASVMSALGSSGERLRFA